MFGDVDLRDKVMLEKEPAKMKALGSTVKSYDEKRWHDECPTLTYRGLRAKFESSKDLADPLLETGKRLLVEASTDKFWGIGVMLRSKDLFDRSKWTGENALGQALMQVRDELKG